MATVYVPTEWLDGQYRFSLEPVPGWVDVESIPIDELSERLTRLIIAPGLPPITEPPMPGDIIRDNYSLCAERVTQVTETQDGLHIACRTVHGGARCYYNAVRLEHGRLLVGTRCAPGTTGGGMYPDGQQELFILERAPRRPEPMKPITPVGKRAVLTAQLSLFA
jgi:hypothetical protein